MKDIHGDYGPGTEQARKMLACGGYKTGGAVKPKKAAKHGGSVKGEVAADRPDRRARGGKIGTVIINVKSGGQDDAMKQDMAAKAGLQKGVAMGAQMAAAKLGGDAPPLGHGGMPPGAPPPGPMAGPGGPPPMMPPRKSGGSIPHLDAGAGSARGRMEKQGMIPVKAHMRRRGGPC